MCVGKSQSDRGRGGGGLIRAKAGFNWHGNLPGSDDNPVTTSIRDYGAGRKGCDSVTIYHRVAFLFDVGQNGWGGMGLMERHSIPPQCLLEKKRKNIYSHCNDRGN